MNALLENNADKPRRSRLTMRRIFDSLQDDGYQALKRAETHTLATTPHPVEFTLYYSV